MTSPTEENGAAYCKKNAVVHDRTTYAPACQSQACGWQPAQQTVTDQACAENEICQDATCVPIQDVALVVGDDVQLQEGGGLQFAMSGAGRSLNAEEAALKALLESYPSVRVSLVKASQATYDNLKKAKAVAAADYYPNAPLKRGVLEQLLSDGKKVMLVHDAVGYYDERNPYTTANTFIRVTQGSQFLSNYSANREYDNYIGVQTGGQVFQDWKQYSIGSADGFGGYGSSAGYVEGTAGGRWSMWGYDVSKLTDEGRIMARQMVEWTLKVPASKVAIPKDAVVLLAKDYAAAPVLTDRETALKKIWEEKGFTVQVLPQSKRLDADYANAKAVAAAEDIGFQLPDFWSGLADKKPVLLVHGAARMIWPVTPQGSTYTKIHRDGQKAFLSKYDPREEAGIPLTAGGTSFLRRGWGYGFNQLDWTNIYDGALAYRESAKAKSVLFGYDVSQLTPQGKVMLDEAVRYMLNDNAYAATIPEGHVALLVQDYEGQVLTADEQAARDQLQAMGLSGVVVPYKYFFKTDMSKAAFALIAENPGHTSIAHLMDLPAYAPRLWVMHEGFNTFTPTTAAAASNFQMQSGEGFLKNYYVSDQTRTLGLSQAGGTSTDYYAYQQPWNRIGYRQVAGSLPSGQGAYVMKNAAGTLKNRCGAVFGHTPKDLNGQGKIMFQEIARWLYWDCFKGQVEPSNLQVADYAAKCEGESFIGPVSASASSKARLLTPMNADQYSPMISFIDETGPGQDMGTWGGSASDDAGTYGPDATPYPVGSATPLPPGQSACPDSGKCTYNPDSGTLASWEVDAVCGREIFDHITAFALTAAAPGFPASSYPCGSDKVSCGPGTYSGMAWTSTEPRPQLVGANVQAFYKNGVIGPAITCTVPDASSGAGTKPESGEWTGGGLPKRTSQSACAGEKIIPASAFDGLNFYKAQLEYYYIDDLGTVTLNGDKVIDKQGACWPGKEVKGVCTWSEASKSWNCLGGAESVCPKPATPSILHRIKHGESQTMAITVQDWVYGEVKGEAVVRVYRRS